MKGEIIKIQKVFNDDLTFNCYELIIDVVEEPPFRLGKCKIIQEENKNGRKKD